MFLYIHVYYNLTTAVPLRGILIIELSGKEVTSLWCPPPPEYSRAYLAQVSGKVTVTNAVKRS